MIGLAPSSYYYRPQVDSRERARRDAELRDRIERIHVDFPGYGYRRIQRHLRREGLRVNAKRIRRVQQAYQLFPVIWRTFKVAIIKSAATVLMHRARNRAVMVISSFPTLWLIGANGGDADLSASG